MQQFSGSRSSPEPSGTVIEWIEAAEKVRLCGRMLHDGLAQHAARWQLTAAEFSLLWACRGAPTTGMSQNELAEALAVSAAHVSGLVEQLRKKGLFVGRRTPADRRRRLWQLTPSGKAALDALLVDLTAWCKSLDELLGPDAPCALDQPLNRLAGAIRRISNGANPKANGSETCRCTTGGVRERGAA